MKNILFLFLFILFSCETKSQQNSKANNDLPNYRISHVKNYIKGKDYNQDIAIFINFRIPSNRFRFFIYDLKNNKVLEKAIVSHGSGSVIKGSKELKFSNTENSYQSSLGKYAIMNSYRDWETDRKSTRLNSSHRSLSRMPSSA